MLQRTKRALVNRGIVHLPPRYSLALQFRRCHGWWPDFKNPKTFSEKIQYRKLYDRDPRLVDHADKVLAKDIVTKKLGSEWITPTLWHGVKLPPLPERTWPKPYVIKANHGSGWNIFVRSETDEDWPAIERQTGEWIHSRFAPLLYEPGYNEIVPQILIEPFIGRDSTCRLTTSSLFSTVLSNTLRSASVGQPHFRLRSITVIGSNNAFATAIPPPIILPKSQQALS